MDQPLVHPGNELSSEDGRDQVFSVSPATGETDANYAFSASERALVEPTMSPQAYVFPLTEASGGDASLRGTIANVVNGILGGGTLALAFSCKLDGLAMGVCLIVAVALLSERSALLLFYCADKTKSRLYSDIGGALFGPRARVFVDVVVMMQNFGLLTGYIVLLMDLLPPLTQAVTSLPLLTHPAYVVPCVTAAVLFPLSAMPRLDFLKFGSVLAMVCVTSLAAALVAFAVIAQHRPDAIPGSRTDLPLELAPSGPHALLDVLRSIPVVFFAFVVHNTALLLYGELRRRSTHDRSSKWQRKRRKMLFAVRIGLAICCSLYLAVGGSGYLIFRSTVESDVLRSFTGDTFPAIRWLKLAMVLVITFSFPIISFALRKSLHALLFGTKHLTSTPHRAALAAGIAAATCAVGVAAGHNVSVVFGLTGSLTSTCVMYIFPSIGFLRLRLSQKTPQEFAADVPVAVGVLSIGLGVMFASTAGILYGVFTGQ